MRPIVCVFAALTLLSTTTPAQSITIAAKPTFTIGEGDAAPEYEFNQIGFVKRMSDGRIIVTMGPDIRFYDGHGKYVAKAGGKGQGPGEFQYIQALYVLPGDTLVALNFRDKVWLTRDGKYIRKQMMDQEPLNTNGWFAEGAFLLPNGNLLAQQYEQEKPGDPRMKDLHRPVLRYALLDFASRKVQTLITSGGLRQIIDGRNGAVQPFTPHAQHAIGDDRVYVGDNDTTFISVFSLDGKPLGTVTVADHATPVTAKDLAAYHDRTVEQYSSNAQRKEQFEAGWSIVPKPKRFPYWGTALVDRTGDLWVSDPVSANPKGALAWSVFNRNGKRIGRVTMPVGFGPREIGADYVLGVARDDLGVESIRMYALTRSAR